jgi:ATP-dependent Clp protease adapter protein ClpS
MSNAMLDLLLIDMAGVMDEQYTPAVVDIVRVRLGLSQWVGIDVMGEEFFMRTAPGRVAPVEVEEALNEMEEYIWEDWQPGEETEPTNFLIGLLIDRRTPRDFLLQVLEELMQRTDELPTVLAVQVRKKGNPQVTLIDRADLPLKWRCLVGDAVVLNSDVWLEGEWEAAGDAPAIPRGTALTIVERAVFDGARVNRECLLAVITREGQVDPQSVALPWLLVTHPSEWGSNPAQRETGRAVATFQLPCWFSVQVEEHDRVKAATSAESGRSA